MQIAPFVRLEGDTPQWTQAKWGLISSWAKDPSIGNRMVNARGETLAEKPAFRSAFKSRGCLVPADGFYEWQKTTGGKQPWRFVRRDRKTFLFSGLWERWRPDDSADWLVSFSIITTGPNGMVKPLHHRMPVILGPMDAKTWLATGSEPETLKGLIAPVPTGCWIGMPWVRTSPVPCTIRRS